MSVDSAGAVQAALYDLLTGSAPLMALLAGGVLDHVPPGTAFPYVVLGETEARTFGTQDASGNEVTVALHVYSRLPGMQQLRGILATLHDALHGADFAVTGQVLLSCRHVDTATKLEDDGLTRHGVSRFRILTEPV